MDFKVSSPDIAANCTPTLVNSKSTTSLMSTNSISNEGSTKPRRTKTEKHAAYIRGSSRSLRALMHPIAAEMKDYCLNTNTHGVKRIVIEPNKFVKLFWIIVFSAAFASNCWHISQLAQNYLSHPANEGTSLIEEDVVFPSVTVCNHEPASPSAALSALYDSNSALSAYQRLLALKLPTLTSNDSSRNYNEFLKIPSVVYQNIGEPEASNIGHKMNDFIISCTFAGRPCDINQTFSYFQDSYYYNCFTFNAKSSDIVVTGPMNGLGLIIFLENSTADSLGIPYNHASPIDNSVGIRITIHNQGTVPLPRTQGFDISPGFSFSAAMKLDHIVKLGPPYSTCVNADDPRLAGQAPYNYSLNVCLDLCYANYVFDLCGCISAWYRVPDYFKLQGNFCSFLNVSTEDFVANINCERDARRQLSSDTLMRSNCQCDPPCDSYEYSTSLSQALWPSTASAVDFYRYYVTDKPNTSSPAAYKLRDSILNEPDQGKAATVVRRHFVRLNVFLKTLTVSLRQDSVGYPTVQLLSDVGGTIGLWIGLSVISVTIELWALIYNIAERYVKGT